MKSYTITEAAPITCKECMNFVQHYIRDPDTNSFCICNAGRCKAMKPRSASTNDIKKPGAVACEKFQPTPESKLEKVWVRKGA